jgi:NAD(P)-dependent dehydrogenase (short-subunit alcohol dehydrogenase family)
MKGGGLWLAAFVAGAGIAALTARAAVRHSRAFDPRGRVALVTGGSRGLGLLLARRLAAAGAKVAICARDVDELERARTDLGAGVLAVRCDLTDRAQVDALVAAIAERFGSPIEILINNAGTIQVGPMETMTEADYDEALRLHFWAPYHTVHAVLPAMRARRAGRIVNISSIGGKVAVPHLLPYSASKFALTGFSEGLRSELLKDGIYVTTFCPGLIRTGSPRNAYFKGRHREEYAWFTLSDSLPGLSQSADACADRIIDALRHGDAEVVTSLPGKAAALLHGVFPGMVADVLGEINRLLPAADGPGSIGTARRRGSESESAVTESPLTGLTRKAEADNNQRSAGDPVAGGEP